MKKINVLSLFDGIGCGRVALGKAGIAVKSYYSSEIDEYALKISRKNWPEDNSRRLGDISLWRQWDIDFSSIDLILAGPPCQSFSLMGSQKGFGDSRGDLMLTFFDILDHTKKLNPSIKFLMENVKMKPLYMSAITEKLGVEPAKINSSHFLPQSRTRFYWSNFLWSPIKYADDCSICEDTEEAYCDECDCLYADCDCIGPHEDKVIFDEDYENGFRLPEEPVHFSKVVNEKGWFPATVRKGNPRKVVYTNEIFGCLTASYYKGIRSDGRPAIAKCEGVFDEMRERGEVRMLSPEECELLQGLPEGYTKGVSNTQRYKSIGNGWSVDVIAKILGNFS